MAIGEKTKPCNLVLHDDAVSSQDILCGANLLSLGEIAYLDAPGAKALCVRSSTLAANDDDISVHVVVAKLFGFENRMKASVQIVEDIETATATHVEVSFRDQHLSRADMWRIKSQIDSSVLYEKQQLSYLGSMTATVEAIYIAGSQVSSAFVSHPQTKFIFRSISARFTILIQISKEMLETWLGGDLLYEAIVSGFLPELFQRWNELKARHQVSVVLFGRRQRPSHHGEDGVNLNAPGWEDFFHPLALDMPSTNWKELLRHVKRAFSSVSLPRQVSLAADGNMLQAINLASMDFANSNIDPRLSSTSTSVIAVTAGAGLFRANYGLLRSTTELLMGSNIGVDIVHVSPKPLHPVPLFEYPRNGSIEYALPHWVDASYWTQQSTTSHGIWLWGHGSACLSNVKLPRLKSSDHDSTGLSVTMEQMDSYDDHVFGGPSTIDSQADVKARNTHNVVTPVKARSKIGGSGISLTPALTKTHASNTDAKGSSKEVSNPRSLMQMDRKISFGPRGLAPTVGVASTTVSAQHAQQGREATPSPTSHTTATTSILSKQIQDSLRRKPSHEALVGHNAHDSHERSQSVAIPSDAVNSLKNPGDPANLIAKGLEKSLGTSLESDSLSATPIAQSSTPLLQVPEKDNIEDGPTSVNPWLTLMNPSNPRKTNMHVASEYRQWQNVFPTAVSSDVVKWKSMCSPAALPLVAEGRFSLNELERHFQKRVRRLLVPTIATSIQRPAQQALWHMIVIRLSAGYQVVPLRKSPYGQLASEYLERVLLSLGNRYHELRCISDAEVQVTEYERASIEQSVDEIPSSLLLTSMQIGTTLSTRTRRVTIDSTRAIATYDWAKLDDDCVNGAEMLDSDGLCRMRFVLIPVDMTRTETQTGNRELSDDERRLDGIQKLTQLWQRHRYLSDDEQRHLVSMAKSKISTAVERDPNPLAIEYVTRDISAIIGAYGSNLFAQIDGEATGRLFTESEQYHSSDFDLIKLVKQMQESPPNGVELKDRRWFTRLHLKCFRGDQMVNWLLSIFKDIDTREDAVALGNQLMDLEIFTHVRGKHEFRDGNFFYQIKAAHRTTDYPDTAGFFSKPLGRSVPSTPVAEYRQSPSGAVMQSARDSVEDDARTPTLAPADKTKKREILLSQKLPYNVDLGKRSGQAEVVNLHYDRIHNPENCFHILLDWTSTTPKLIRESVARWSSMVESHGLRLVQLPVREASKLQEQHPFDQPISVKLKSRPPETALATPQIDPQSFSPRSVEDQNGYHKAVLRKCGFVLDTESAKSFPRGVDVSYSWGSPDYEYTQFVHKSGLLLVQIVNSDTCDFLISANRLAQQPATGPGKKAEPATAETIANELVSFCRDEKALVAFFDSFNKPKAATSSPFANSLAADNDVPPIELPPHLSHRALLKRAG